MPIEFSKYMNIAQRYVATHSEHESETNKVGLLMGREIKILPQGKVDLDISTDAARTDFINSFVAEFGENLRKDVVQALGSGKNAKPLTSRMIVKLGELGRERTKDTVAARLKDIVLNAAKRDAGIISMNELDAVARKYSHDPELKKQFDALSAMRDKVERLLAEFGEFTGEEIGRAIADDSPIDRNNPERMRNLTISELVSTVVAQQIMLTHNLTALYEKSGRSIPELLPLIAKCKSRYYELLAISVRLETNALAKAANPKGEAEDDNWRDMLVRDIIPVAAAEMHGTDATLNSLKKYLAPIADRVDKLKKNASDGEAHWTEARQIRRELADAREALRKASETGIEYNGAKINFKPSQFLLESLASLFDEVEKDIKGLMDEFERAEKLGDVNMVFPKASGSKLFSSFGIAILGKLVGDEAMVIDARNALDMIHAALVSLVETMAILQMNACLLTFGSLLIKNGEFHAKMEELVDKLLVTSDRLNGREIKDEELQKLVDEVDKLLETLDENQRRELDEAIKEAQQKSILGALLCLDRQILESFANRLKTNGIPT